MAFYYLLYLVHTLIICIFFYILCIFLNFHFLAKILNFKLIEVTWKLGYLRRLNLVQQKWLRRHYPCLHVKLVICFWMWWQMFSHKIWVMDKSIHQDHKNKVSRPSKLKSKTYKDLRLQINTVCSGKLNHSYIQNKVKRIKTF